MEPSRINKLFSNLSTGKKYMLSIFSLVLLIGILTFSVFEATKATVTVYIDGEEVIVQTHSKTIEELMIEQGWEATDYDEIEPPLHSKITGNMFIEWKKAKSVLLTNNGEQEKIWTTAGTVEELIHSLQITVGEHDKLDPSLQTEIEPDMHVNYESAFKVRLNSDGTHQEVWTTSTTVADFLERETITLGELDRVEPAKDKVITDETDIHVIRVEKVTDVVEETVKYATVTRKDNSLPRGQEEVVQQGEEGLVKKHYEVILENGEEVSRELIKTENAKVSKDRIVAVGTRQITQSVSRGSSPQSTNQEISGKTLTVTATAYTASCNGCSGITATGVNLNNNRNAKVIAVDPDVIPLGSKVHVEGYGTAIAADTGSAIQGNKIDVHMPTKADARRWGRKTVKITILE